MTRLVKVWNLFLPKPPCLSEPMNPPIFGTEQGRKCALDRLLYRGHEKQRRLRENRLEKEGYVPRRKALNKHVRSAMLISTFPSTSGAYSAKPSQITSPAIEHSVVGLVADGFELIQWDGL